MQLLVEKLIFNNWNNTKTNLSSFIICSINTTITRYTELEIILYRLLNKSEKLEITGNES